MHECYAIVARHEVLMNISLMRYPHTYFVLIQKTKMNKKDIKAYSHAMFVCLCVCVCVCVCFLSKQNIMECLMVGTIINFRRHHI